MDLLSFLRQNKWGNSEYVYASHPESNKYVAKGVQQQCVKLKTALF